MEATDPLRFVPLHLLPRPMGRVLPVGAGEASARMGEAVEAVWGPCEGIMFTRYRHGRPTRGVEVVEAAHPVPDAADEAARPRMLGSPTMNIRPLEGRAIAGGVIQLAAVPERAIPMGIGPEALWLGEGAGEEVVDVRPSGGTTVVMLGTAAGRLLAPLRGQPAVAKGARVGLPVDPALLHFFGAGGAALRMGGTP